LWRNLSDKKKMVFCSMCGGIGYRGFKKIEGNFVCRACNGYGCRRCNQGIVDWITHANGKDMIGDNKHL